MHANARVLDLPPELAPRQMAGRGVRRAKILDALSKEMSPLELSKAFLAGYPLWEITQWMGHGDASTTAEIYLSMSYEVARLVRASGFKATALKPDEANVSPDVSPLKLEA